MIKTSPKACVIGWPIAHSRSPLIHGYWLKQHGISGEYDRRPVQPHNLQSFFTSIRHGELQGCNVTLPHKQAAFAHIDVADDRAQRIGAVNTVWVEREKLMATSTDGPGFVENLKLSVPQFTIEGSVVTLLGAGGSARAVIDELLRNNCRRVMIFNRTQQRAHELVEIFGKPVEALPIEDMRGAFSDTDLLVNATSAGISNDGKLELPWRYLKPSAVVADLSYVPLITPFLQEAESGGHRIVSGLGMLLHQAIFGFEKWFGVKPTVTDELYALVARDIDPDYRA